MNILIFEDDKYKNLFPLSNLRAVFDVRIGANTIKERIELIINKKYDVNLLCRNKLSGYLSEIHKNKINTFSNNECLLLNGRVIFSEESINYLLSKKEKNTFYTYRNEIIAAYLHKDKAGFFKENFDKSNDNSVSKKQFEEMSLKQIVLKDDFNVTLICYPWDVINYIIHGGLNYDLELTKNNFKKIQKIKESQNFINHKRIFISKNTNIGSNTVIDASQGIVMIDEGVQIEPFTYIKGPVFIGKNVLVKSGAKIYGPCVIGEYSKVAGEIAESVFHSYVNKQHDGFIGHSYICPFVNLGADTVTSDLKNNYSKIIMNSDGSNIDTGMQFLGSIIGDHSKTSINTMLNTGTVIGIFANIFGGGFPEKNIDSFSWYDCDNNSGKKIKYDLDKALETSKIVMERRGVDFSKTYEKLVKNYY